MNLWVDSVRPAPNEQEYSWIKSADMAMFALTLNERKGCPYEGIDIGHVEGGFGCENGKALLEWLETTRREYPVRVHADDSFERIVLEDIVQRNSWGALDSNQVQKGTRRLHLTIQCMAVYESGIDVPADMSLEEAIAYAKQHLKEVPLGTMEYVQDSDVLDEENCDFEEVQYGLSVEERLADAEVRADKSDNVGRERDLEI